MSEQPLDGAVALVTGAARGIGAATAHRLARAGAAVALVARHRDDLDQVADDIAQVGGRAFAVEADLTEPERAEDAVQDTLDRLGRLDILVNNAGIRLLNTALHTTVEEWDRMVAANVAALLHVTHAAVPHLIYAASTSPRQVADLVNVSSTAGRFPRAGSSVYGLTTSGMDAFAESLRQELAVEGVRVSVVRPGAVEPGPADPFDGLPWDASRAGNEGLRPEDVADAVGYVVTRDRRVAVNELLVRAGGRAR